MFSCYLTPSAGRLMCSWCSGQALGPTSLPSVPVDQALPWVCGAGYRFPQNPPKYNRSEKSVQQPAAVCRLVSLSLARQPRMPGDIAGLPRILLLPGMLLSSGPGMYCSVTGIPMSGAPALPGRGKKPQENLLYCARELHAPLSVLIVFSPVQLYCNILK